MSKKQRINRPLVYSRFVTIRDKFGKARTEIDWVPLEGVVLEEPGGWDPSAHYCYELTHNGKPCGVWQYVGTIDSEEKYNGFLEYNPLRVSEMYTMIIAAGREMNTLRARIGLLLEQEMTDMELARNLSRILGNKEGGGLFDVN